MNNRDQSIDVLRGLALFIMLFANAAPYLIKGEHFFIIRVIDSFAAPMFISIAGYSALLSTNKNTLFFKNFKRGLFVVLMAVFIDSCIWKITPFIGYDVLYIIGFCVIFSHFLIKVKSLMLILLLILIAICGFILQVYFYKNQIEDINLTNNFLKDIYFNLPAFIVYGWFPFFPWASIFIFGIIIKKEGVFIEKNWKNYYSLILLFGFIVSLYFIYGQQKIVRDGYSELFYPMDLLFFIFSITFLSLIFIYKSFFSSSIFKFLNILGQHSMFVYLLHCIYIAYFLENIFFQMNEIIVLRLIVFYLTIYLFVLILIQLKKWKRWPTNSFILRFIFGS